MVRLYIDHGRRRIVHFNTTAHPTSEWIVSATARGVPLALSPVKFSLIVATPRSLLAKLIAYCMTGCFTGRMAELA